MIIAIDGSTASGKGTLAKRIAGRLGLPHLDTGLLYRAVGIAAQRAGIDLADAAGCAQLASRLRLADFDEKELRGVHAGEAASRVAALGEVRRALMKLQRDFAGQPRGAVLDGRDIGTVIAPDADVKFWIDATLDERARRRWKELSAGGAEITLGEVTAAVAERDARDRSRTDAPALAAVDAVRIDTTAMTPDEVLAAALAVIAARD
jgi:CMP/dCMP kinase